MPIDADSFNEIVKIYQTEIDSLIENMGKEVTLHFKDTVANVNNEFYDPIHGRDIKMPAYKGTGANPEPTITEHTKTIKALIRIDPSDFRLFAGMSVQEPNALIRLKTYLTDIPDLKRCEFIVPFVPDIGIIDTKYHLLREPIPAGLKENRYALTYWGRT